MSIPVLGSDSKAYSVAQASLGAGPSANGILVAIPTDHNLASAANIATLSAQITGALAPTGGLPVTFTGTLAATQSGAWTVAVSNLPTLGQKASSGSVSTDQASNGVIATAYGTLADAATPDITAGGASFTFSSLFKGQVANLFAIKNALLGTIKTQPQPAFTPTQTAVAIPAFVSGNTAGTGGTNATVTLIVTTSATQRYCSIFNTGTANAEIWFGAIPSDANVNQSPGKGLPLPAGSGFVYDVAVPAGTAIYVTAASATGLSVVTG